MKGFEVKRFFAGVSPKFPGKSSSLVRELLE